VQYTETRFLHFKSTQSSFLPYHLAFTCNFYPKNLQSRDKNKPYAPSHCFNDRKTAMFMHRFQSAKGKREPC